MDKSKKSISKIGKYLREISVVVIGVAITLSVSLWITHSNDKKNLALYLDAILIELHQNGESFDEAARLFQKSARYAKYINSHDEKSMSKDSLDYYRLSDDDGFGYGLIQSNTIYLISAFEMFKSSGAMRQLDNKELLTEIWGIYIQMENVQHFIEMCFQRKGEESMIVWQRSLDGKPNTVPMQNFFSSDLPYQMVRQNNQVAKAIRHTISKLEVSKFVKR